MKYNQKDIIKFNFPLPNGRFEPHPAIIISTDEVHESKSIYYALMISTKQQLHSHLAYEINNSLLNSGKLPKEKSWVKCQLIAHFDDRHAIDKFGTLKVQSFKELMHFFTQNVFGL